VPRWMKLDKSLNRGSVMKEGYSVDAFLTASSVDEAIKKLPFEDGMKLVEALVGSVESGNLTLDQALQAYERGSSLIDHLRAQLEGAEAKLKVLNEKRLNRTTS
jgi:exodeoxyribonuclease VII small subunit